MVEIVTFGLRRCDITGTGAESWRFLQKARSRLTRRYRNDGVDQAK